MSAQTGSEAAAPPAVALSPERAAELGEWALVREWTQRLITLELSGGNGDESGESVLLGYKDDPLATLELTHAHPSGLAMLLAGRRTRLSDLVREPGALADARRRARGVRTITARLRRLHGVEAEQLAVGMASWGESSGQRSSAPVLLRGARLRPRGHGEEDYDLDLAPATRLNPMLVEHLRLEYGVPLDAALMAELASGADGFDPLPMLTRLAESCADIPGFAVEARLIVGAFPEPMPALVADLEARGTTILTHRVVAQLVGPPGDPARSAAGRPPVAGSEPTAVVLDADGDQQAAVDLAAGGADLAVLAAPGSGQTQLLADLVAALGADGRSCLLLSSYAEELEAVQARLASVGLGGLLLLLGEDPHDAAAIAARLMESVEAALADAGAAPTERPLGTAPEAVVRDRAAVLDQHVEALHQVHEPWGVSAYAAQVALAELTALRPAPRSRVRLGPEVLDGLPTERMGELRDAVREAAEAGAFRQGPADDPWYAARLTSEQEAAEALEQVRALAGRGAGGHGGGELAEAREVLDEAFEQVGLPPAATVASYGVALTLLGQVRATQEVFRPEAWDVSLDEAVAATAPREWRSDQGVHLGPVARSRIVGRTRALLRPGVPPADLHGALLELQRQRRAWGAFTGGGARPDVPAGYDDAVRAHAALTARLHWLSPRLASTPGGGDLIDMELDALQDRLIQLSEHGVSLAVRPRVIGLLDRLQAAGLGPVVDDLAARTVPPELVERELDLVWWASVLGVIGASDPRYGQHDGDALRETAREFAAADLAVLAGHAERVRQHVAARIRTAAAAHPDQLRELRAWGGVSAGERGGALLARPRVAMPVTELLIRCADLIAAIAPCRAMSPLLVSALLPTEYAADVVIMAGAQRTDLAQAVLGIARGASLVVAGDARLPGPSDQVDSVLALAIERLQVAALHGSYRPIDERLAAPAAAVSAALQDQEPESGPAGGAAVVIAGAGHLADPVVAVADRSGDHESAVRLDRVDGSGVVAPGAAAVESTDAEVHHVVRLVMDHARDHPDTSLAVITLSTLHAERIRDAVRLERGVHPRVAAFFDADAPEPFFVGSAGDAGALVRDAVIVSVGFGRTPHGRVLHQFGAVSEPGGGAMVLAAATRARSQMVVVSAFGATDLDPSRLRTPGPRALGALLAAAESAGAEVPATRSEPSRIVDHAPADGAEAPDALMADFARRLEQAGLTVLRRVPLAGHEGASAGPQAAAEAWIDLGVLAPDGVIRLAVDSDGPAYAALGSARERERLRPEQLARLGWTHLRVWSCDIFRDPDREVGRVLMALGLAVSDPDPDPVATVRSADGEPPARDKRPAEDKPPAGDKRPADDKRPAEDKPPAGDARPAQSAPEQTVPEQTVDDTDVGWGEIPPSPDSHDDWLREQRPPHWG